MNIIKDYNSHTPLLKDVYNPKKEKELIAHNLYGERRVGG